jgi:ubiquinone biosynthesis monooxygenase Coq7
LSVARDPAMLHIDSLIVEFDKGLRTVFGVTHAVRPMPGGDVEEPHLSLEERRDAAALMRVNHCGEICAQALYQGQGLASDNAELKRALVQAAREEADHLAWTEQRIADLGGRTSLLNPLWYVGSLAIGFAAGKFGDAWNLGFLKETERQVELHLQGHLDRLSAKDVRTRTVVAAMQRDEAGHARVAEALGAKDPPGAVKSLMRAGARVMTSCSYWI